MNLASEIGQMYFLKWLQLIFWKYLDFWKTPLHKPSKEQKIWFYFKSLTVPFSIFDAHVVSMPAVLKLSFTAIGIPSRMPSGWPALGTTVRQHRLKQNVCYIDICSHQLLFILHVPLGGFWKQDCSPLGIWWFSAPFSRTIFHSNSSLEHSAQTRLGLTEQSSKPSRQTAAFIQAGYPKGVHTSSSVTTQCLFQP